MFDRIVCIDYGYFRELDGEWYSVRPGPFTIKMPFIHEHLAASDSPLYDLRKHYNSVSDYFDEWIVVDCDEDYQDITLIHLRKKFRVCSAKRLATGTSPPRRNWSTPPKSRWTAI